MKNKTVYILGTGLSHDGSACLLKDGKIIVAIEKERITRHKHDGGNDTEAVQYCLDAAGITINDLSLVIQCSNFEKEIDKTRHKGKRLFPENYAVPFVTISHHLAHAWSAIATSPFTEANVIIIDGCGSPYQQCDDLNCYLPESITQNMLHCEKDSYYSFSQNALQPLYKDFAEVLTPGGKTIKLPTIRHSIGGLYSMVSHYTFGNLDDAGKLMGLAPYGSRKETMPLFNLRDGRCFVNEEAYSIFNKPSQGYDDFKTRFQYFADIAAWVQQEVEEAILYTINSRLDYNYHPNLCYAGGVALNAKANARILRETNLKQLYIQPAAGDNGLSIGCAYYGWHHIQQQPVSGNTGYSNYYGKTYSDTDILTAIQRLESENNIQVQAIRPDNIFDAASTYLLQSKTIGWFQGGAEFGPRALGNRSIIADPRIQGIREHINAHIKFREDFRPFAPSVLADNTDEYFVHAYHSPHMILVDEMKEHWLDKLNGVAHKDKSARTQTVEQQTNPVYYKLLQQWKEKSGISVLLNTSFNRRGMPIVETPYEALSFFYECALDVLVLNDFIICK